MLKYTTAMHNDVPRGKGIETFSIRQKVEQYRHKIKKLKQEVDHQIEADNTKVIRNVQPVRETPQSKNDVSIKDRVENEKTSKISNEEMDQDEKMTPILSHETSKPRSSSACTWNTWRNMNDSYAYNDVIEYMDEEKAYWIKKWVHDVNWAMKDVIHDNVL